MSLKKPYQKEMRCISWLNRFDLLSDQSVGLPGIDLPSCDYIKPDRVCHATLSVQRSQRMQAHL